MHKQFTRLHTLELPRDYQLVLQVTVRVKVMDWSSRLSRWVHRAVQVGRRRVRRYRREKVSREVRVVDPARPFEVHYVDRRVCRRYPVYSQPPTVGFSRVVRGPKRRAINFIIARMKGRAMAYNLLSGPSEMQARAVTIPVVVEREWEAQMDLEYGTFELRNGPAARARGWSGGVGPHAAVKGSPLLVFLPVLELLAYLGERLGVALLVVMPSAVVWGVFVWWLLHGGGAP